MADKITKELNGDITIEDKDYDLTRNDLLTMDEIEKRNITSTETTFSFTGIRAVITTNGLVENITTNSSVLSEDDINEDRWYVTGKYKEKRKCIRCGTEFYPIFSNNMSQELCDKCEDDLNNQIKKEILQI